MIWKGILFSFIMACGSEIDVIEEEIAIEEYSWTCHDYEDWTDINIEYSTCDDILSIHAAYKLINRPWESRFMEEGEDCVYTMSFRLIEEVCMEIEAIKVIGYHES